MFSSFLRDFPGMSDVTLSSSVFSGTVSPVWSRCCVKVASNTQNWGFWARSSSVTSHRGKDARTGRERPRKCTVSFTERPLPEYGFLTAWHIYVSAFFEAWVKQRWQRLTWIPSNCELWTFSLPCWRMPSPFPSEDICADSGAEDISKIRFGSQLHQSRRLMCWFFVSLLL